MNEQTDETVNLTSREKKQLRGMGHHLEPAAYAGREGFSPTLLDALRAALKAHELIKVKIGQNCPVERNQAGQEAAGKTGAALVQVIGRMLLLYRPNPELPEARRISLTADAGTRQPDTVRQKGNAAVRARRKT
jgi:Predicted RNA-binding protein containing KH domain, possibly ribosomal protein